jgi:hypothetical protein
MEIESGLFASPLGLLLIFAIVIGLGLAIYVFGATIVGKMRQARLQEKTDGSGMQTGDPVNPVLDPEETMNPSNNPPNGDGSERKPPAPL